MDTIENLYIEKQEFRELAQKYAEKAEECWREAWYIEKVISQKEVSDNLKKILEVDQK